MAGTGITFTLLMQGKATKEAWDNCWALLRASCCGNKEAEFDRDSQAVNSKPFLNGVLESTNEPI